MSTYTSKTKVPESKQQFIEESSRQKRQTLLTIILIFFLILLLLFSVLISNKFTITSMDVRKSSRQLDLAYYEIDKIQNIPAVTEQTTSPPIIYEEKTAEKVIQPQATKEVTQKTTQPYQTTTTKETVKISESEKKVGVDGKIITAKNIQTYHSILLKEFEKEDIFSYKIIWGDTLWKIALKFNTTAHTLYVLNALDNPDLIIAGKYLKVVKDFKLPKEKTEKILKEAIKGKTGYNNIENSFACINNIFNIMQIDILSLFKNEESII